jgi:hypothetical protein
MALLAACFKLVSYLAYSFYPEDGGDMFNGLHSVTSQKIELSITTAVRTPYRT